MGADFSIVIPCFNESGNVPQVIARLAKIMPQAPCATEVIFADGGSTDGTAELLRSSAEAHGLTSVKVLSLSPGGGYGRDIMQGLEVAEGDVLAWTHADMQTDLRDVFTAYERYAEQGSNRVFVKGRRKNRALLEAFFSFGMQLVTFAAIRIYLSDINAQPKLFDRDFYETKLKGNAPDDFSLDLYAFYSAKTNGYDILTIPVYFAKREHGEAKGGGGGWKSRIRLIRRTNSYIWQLGAQIRAEKSSFRPEA